ncbi:MAG: hypothetical protein K9K82_04105 [Desulfobacteraceae bacterium]|nr:hypothetical protein [Desulfobacteraceae bacterium]
MESSVQVKLPPGSLSFVRGVLLLMLCLLLGVSGCRSLAPIEPVGREVRADMSLRCRAHFMSHPWQLVQSMTAYLPGGDVRNGVAVIRIQPNDGRIKCVIMSVEGIVLFDGEYDGGVSINRAVSPFDEKKFARAMFADIRLAFMPPEGRLEKAGTLSDGTPICRYTRSNSEGFVEIRLSGENRPEIRRYTGNKKLRETVKLCYAPACELPQSIETGEIPAKVNIFHHGFFDYRLELNLLKAKKLPEE